MHDGEPYGVLFWPLTEIATAIGINYENLVTLVQKDILKGADTGQQCPPFIYVPRHARQNGKPVTLIAQQLGPIWFSSRMVVDEYRRTRLEKSLHKPRKPAPSPLAPKGDKILPNPLATNGTSPLEPKGVHLGAHLSEDEDEDEDEERLAR